MANAMIKHKLCKAIARAIFKNEHTSNYELEVTIQDIAKRNFAYKLANKSTDIAKNYLNAQISANQGAFIFNEKVYPKTLRPRVAQKGVAAFTLEDHLVDEMAETIAKFDAVAPDEKIKINQYIVRSVDTADSLSDLLELFPINYHHVIKTNFKQGEHHRAPRKMPQFEIDDFKVRNASGLDAIKKVVIKNMLLS